MWESLSGLSLKLLGSCPPGPSSGVQLWSLCLQRHFPSAGPTPHSLLEIPCHLRGLANGITNVEVHSCKQGSLEPCTLALRLDVLQLQCVEAWSAECL